MIRCEFSLRRCAGWLLIAWTLCATPALASSDVVISQIYGGGRTSGSTYRTDFLELFNRGSAPVDITGWTVRARSDIGIPEWGMYQPTLSGVIAPGRYFLIQLGSPGSGQLDLPAPDFVLSGGILNTGNTVALVRDAVNDIVGGCPTGARIVDLVGCSSVECAEGTTAEGHYIATATIRVADGCQDTDNNAADFFVAAPSPRNSASPAQSCAVLGVEPRPGLSATSLAVPRPNPMLDRTEIAFHIARDGSIELAVFDHLGRRVRTLERGWWTAGDHTAAWAGDREGGGRAPAGLYFVLLRGPDPGSSVAARLVRLP
jgi:hypothetical protein